MDNARDTNFAAGERCRHGAESPTGDDLAAPHADGIYLLSKGPDGSVRLTKIQAKKPKLKAHIVHDC